MKKQQKMKRYVALLGVLVFLLSTLFTACSSGKSPNEQKQGAEGTEAEISPTVTPEEKEEGSEGTEKVEDPPVVEDPPTSLYDLPENFSLYEAYQEDFLIGTIYTDANRSGKDKELTLKHFNAITPENLMKPEYMQPTEGKFDYGKSDVMVKFAEDNGLKLIGHTLVWHQQSGNWLGRNVSREEAIKQLESHITNIVSQYKGKFTSWDVVNEAINDGVSLPANGDWTKCLRQTQWLTSIGPDYIAMAFQFARKADPDLKLYYNDYNLNNRNKADIVYAMVKDLREQGIPVDGIGMQGHYSINTTPGSVEYSLKKFSELGVEVSITELDVVVDGASPSGLTKEQEIRQAVTYAELFQVFKAYKDTIERVTFWGYIDNKSWRKERFPLLFHGDYSPKEAVYAIYNPERYLAEYKVEDVKEANSAQAKYGTPVIDAEVDELWNSCTPIAVDKQIMAWEGATGFVRVLWDESYVYTLFEVKDPVINTRSPQMHEQDSVEIFLDQDNSKSDYLDDNDGQYRVNCEGVTSFGAVPQIPGFHAVAKKTNEGYLVEMAIPLLKAASEGLKMGFEAQVNDSNAAGMRQSIAKFNDLTDNSYQSAKGWGVIELVK